MKTLLNPSAPKSNYQFKEMGENLDNIRDYIKSKERIFHDNFNAKYLKTNGKMPSTVNEMREYYKNSNVEWLIEKATIESQIFKTK